MQPIVAVRAGSSHLEAGQINLRHQRQAAGSLRAVKALVSGKGHRIDAIRLHVDGHQAGGLGGIDGEQCPLLMGDARHSGHIVDVTGKVGGVGDHRQLRIRLEQTLVGTQIDMRIRGNR